MRRILFLFLIGTVFIFANEKNPLIEKELFPLSNPSFEENLKDWGGNPKNNFMERLTYLNIMCKVAETGYKSKKSLCIVLPEHSSTYLPMSFKLEVEKKYYVSAKIKTEGETYGRLRVVYGASGEPLSSSVGPDTDWKEVGVSFTGTKKGQPRGSNPSIAYCEIRLHASGKEKVYYVGAYAGLIYSRPVKRIRGKVETGYRKKERRIITEFALKSGVKRPVECDKSCVEADLLEEEKGISLILANYSGESQREINIKVNTQRKIKTVYSAIKGMITFKEGNGYIEKYHLLLLI